MSPRMYDLRSSTRSWHIRRYLCEKRPPPSDDLAEVRSQRWHRGALVALGEADVRLDGLHHRAALQLAERRLLRRRECDFARVV